MSHVHVKLEQQPFAMIPKALFDYVTDANAIKLYIGLFTWASGEGHCYPTFTQIQERINMSRATITKSMNKLKEAGLLVVEKGEKKGNLKANNIYFLATNLAKKTPSSKIEPRDFSSSNSKLEPSSNSDIPLVQEIDYNENQLMKINYNDNQESAKTLPSTQEIFFEGLSKNEFKKKGKDDPELVKRFVGLELKKFNEKNPNKYPREFLEYFYNAFAGINEHENTSKASIHLKKKGIPSIGQTLPNWFNYWKPQAVGSNTPKSFAERDRDLAREGMEALEALKRKVSLPYYEGESVGQVNQIR